MDDKIPSRAFKAFLPDSKTLLELQKYLFQNNKRQSSKKPHFSLMNYFCDWFVQTQMEDNLCCPKYGQKDPMRKFLSDIKLIQIICCGKLTVEQHMLYLEHTALIFWHKVAALKTECT